MIDVDRAWARCSQLAVFAGMKLSDFGVQVLVQQFVLAATQRSAVTPVKFPAKCIILNIAAGARPTGAAAAIDYTNGLDMFRVNCQIEAGRYLIGSTMAMASAIFGRGDRSVFPPREQPLQQNTTLLYTLENLTTTEINVDIAHHLLAPLAVG